MTATANTNYAFADTATATVNAQAATFTKNTDGTLAISYTFAKTDLNPVTITAFGRIIRDDVKTSCRKRLGICIAAFKTAL